MSDRLGAVIVAELADTCGDLDGTWRYWLPARERFRAKGACRRAAARRARRSGRSVPRAVEGQKGGGMKKSRKPSKRDTAMTRFREKCLWLLYGAHGSQELAFLELKRDERGSFPAEVGLDTFGRWLGAVQKHLAFVSEEQRAFIARPHVLDRYDDFDTAVTWLYEIGVRA
jgi:hypothetical protein